MKIKMCVQNKKEVDKETTTEEAYADDELALGAAVWAITKMVNHATLMTRIGVDPSPAKCEIVTTTEMDGMTRYWRH